MTKTILLTGATDGIGFETAKLLVGAGHTVLIHGRSEKKLTDTLEALTQLAGAGVIESYRADLSDMKDVEALAQSIKDKHDALDVIINNAGVFSTPQPLTNDGLDVRFVVNTLAPYLLTQRLLPLLPSNGRVVNLSSAAQSSVSLNALRGKQRLGDNQAYAQSKLAITQWSAHLAQALTSRGPAIIAVNPASLLASKMVKDAYGVAGHDLSIGADILVRAALSDEFANASGKYFDNDQGRFSNPHADAMDPGKNRQLVDVMESVLGSLGAQHN